MHELIKIKNTDKDRVFLVGMEKADKGDFTTPESMEELTQLAKTANAEVIGQLISKRKTIDPGCFIGKNKAAELCEICKKHNIETIIFDDELSPSQQRSLEKLTDVRIVDRTNLILNIFARRARSREGILQIELAQLDYLMPRLTGKGISLAQQVGGIKVKGPGEKQIEYERRDIRERMYLLKAEIEKIKLHRQQQRQKRQENLVPIITLVGYTNAGKSTLLNNLTAADVFVEDKLFATLDPTTRKVILPDKSRVLFNDTVGFINKLPHKLVAAFRSTLEETAYSNMLIHVIDASHPYFEKQTAVVEKVLRELKILDKPVIFAFNKVDLVKDKNLLDRLQKQKPHSVAISALNGYGFDGLFKQISLFLKKERKVYSLTIPQSRNDVVSMLYSNYKVLNTKYEKNNVILRAELTESAACKLKEFIRLRRSPPDVSG